MDRDIKEFTIKIKMKTRWIPHFLSMLQYMEHLGKIGSSRMVTLFSDGDGDFRPEFQWDEELSSEADPIRVENGNRVYDAG